MKNNKNLINIANYELGTRVIYASDDFFADANRMLYETQAVFKDEYDENGHWMDGWESRRKREFGNDFCLIKLGTVSKIKELLIDTSHFKGNFPPAISIKGCFYPQMSDEEIIKNEENLIWVDVLKYSDLQGDSKKSFPCEFEEKLSHLRMDIYPDGGIARFRAFGEICFDESLYEEENINVISQMTGTRAVATNNEFFGELKNILKDKEAINMGDGWETRRRREPGFDWGIIELPQAAIIDNLMIDTKFFKGNFADTFSINAAYLPNTSDSSVITQSIFWEELISSQKLEMDKKHYFDNSFIKINKAITHIRINIFPDGGISRLKLFGKFIKKDAIEA